MSIFLSLGRLYKASVQICGSVKHFVTICFFTVSSCKPQAEGPPLVGCPRLLIQYICSYPPYLQAISSIRNPSTRHAVVTKDPLNIYITNILISSNCFTKCQTVYSCPLCNIKLCTQFCLCSYHRMSTLFIFFHNKNFLLRTTAPMLTVKYYQHKIEPRAS
jgi:hypothetical protein